MVNYTSDSILLVTFDLWPW